MASKIICPDCFREKGDFDICPHCGFPTSQDKRELYHLPVGTVLEKRYIIGRVLGFGGFGVTYKTWDTDLGIAVAIKEFYPAGLVTRQPGTCDVIVFSQGGDRESIYRAGYSRFLDEARNMAKFREHPNIVDVYGYFSAHNTAYIVMEFLDGLSLKAYLASVGGKLNYTDTAAVMEPVMRAIEELHSKHILHRDISPDNIFITTANKVKVIDFGAARFSTGESESTMTAVIKPGYAPPEQYQSKSRQSTWTDVYALGATIYRLVTGTIPEESVDRAQEDELKRPSELGIEMPLNAEKAIMKAMALKPGLRFQKVSDMRMAFMDKKEIDYPEIEYKKRRKRRAISAAAILCAMIAVLVGGLIYYMNYSIEPSKIDEDKIVVWIPTQGDAVTTELDNPTAGFLSIEDNEKFDIELVGVSEEEYTQKLVESFGTEDFPDVFRSDFLSQEQREEMAAKVGLYYTYFNMGEYYLLGQNTSVLKELRVIPVSCTFPVAYVNLGLLARIGEEAPDSFASAEDFAYDISRLIDRGTANYCLTANDEILPTVLQMLGIEQQELPLAEYSPESYSNGYDVFAARDSVIYIGSSDELIKVQNTESLRGVYALVPIDAPEVYAQWGGTYCISSAASSNRQKLAMLYLSYLSEIGINSQLPLEKEAFADYVDSNSAFLGFLLETDESGDEYAQRLKLLKEE